MALNIRNPEADRLASEVAALSGQTKTLAVIRPGVARTAGSAGPGACCR